MSSYNLDAHDHVYISKGTIVAYTDNEETWDGVLWDCRNIWRSSGSNPVQESFCQIILKLPVPTPSLTSSVFPAEVKTPQESKVEGSWCNRRDKEVFWGKSVNSFQKCFSTNNEDIGRNKPHHHGDRYRWTAHHQQRSHTLYPSNTMNGYNKR